MTNNSTFSKTTFIRFLSVFAICVSLLISSQASGQIIGDSLNASNTFENPDFTGSVETIFQTGSAAVMDPGVELNAFASIYDVDVTENSLTMTLVSNDGLAFTEYEAGTFDRYYFGFDSNSVDSVAIASGDAQLTNGLTVGLLGPNYSLDVADLFGTGIPVPIEYPNGGFFLEFGEGTNLETLGTNVTINFTSTPVPEPGSAALIGVVGFCVAARRRRNQT